MKNKTMLLVLSVALIFVCNSVFAQITGTLIKTDGGQLQGAIRYLPSTKAYEITAGTASLRVPENQVARLNIPAPKEATQAAQLMRGKNYAQALPLLETVYRTYKNLQWDKQVAPSLAECYLNTGRDNEAIKMVKDMMDAGGEHLTAELFNMYCDTLIKKKMYGDVELAIGKVVQMGARDAAAAAQVKRGDVLKERGKLKEALVDGYLRTVMLYSEIKSVRPEAVYKAMVCFTDLGQQSYAEKMRKILLAEFPNDKYTARVRSGS